VVYYLNWLFSKAGKFVSLQTQRRINNILFLINRLIIHHLLKNKTKSTTQTFVNIPIEKWKHFTWIHSNKNHQSNIYIDGALQQSIDFGVMSLDFESK